MEGAHNTNVAAAVARLYWYVRRGVYAPGSGSGETRQVIRAEYWQNHIQIDRSIKIVDGAGKLGITPLAVAHMLLVGKCGDMAAISAFFHGILTGENLKRGDARLLLRAHLLEIAKERRIASQKLELILRYWNAFRLGRTVSAKARITGAYPKVER
jgi:hypothetical protein